MPTLHVDLREGFNRDTVVIRVNGREIFHSAGVATNYSVGLADRIPVEVEEGVARVEVLLPDRGVERSFEQLVTGPVTLGFSLAPSGEFLEPTVEQSPRYV